MAARKKSPIWDYFIVCENSKYARCNDCLEDVSRGGSSTKSYNTTNLVTLLKRHPSFHQEYEAKKATYNEILAVEVTGASSGSGKQLTLSESYDRSRTWEINDRRAQRIHQRIGEMIALDSQPLSVVDDKGFVSLLNTLEPRYVIPSKKYITETVLPRIHDGIKANVKMELTGIKESIHIIVRDNASNMIKAMEEGGYSDLACFAHTLQLIVHDGVLSQRSVIDIIAICCRIVGHFKRSPLATSHLKEIQANLGIPQHHLKQDVPTRWNSTLYMLQSVQEQKMALAAYSTEHDIPQLTSNQLDIINKVITVLTPVEEITQSISSDASSASVIIPFTRALRKHLEDHDEADRGVRTMKEQMLTSLNRHYRNIETNEAVALATLLDPCFKDRCFSSSGDCARAKDMLCEKVEELSGFCNEITREPVPKRPKTNVVQYLSEILDELR